MKIKRKGLSLVEVIITLFLTISILTGFSQLIAQAAKLKNKTDQTNQMIFLLINRLEELRSRSPAQSEFLIENEEIIRGLSPSENFLCRWKFIPESPLARRIEIEIVSLADPNRKARATLWLTPLLGF